VRVAADGKSDFRTAEHFQAWFRLALEPGRTVELELLRGGRREKVRPPMPG
jgi:hypothetical protein